MAGDKYKASTYAWYQPTGMDNTVNTALGDIVVNLLSQLTPGVAYVGKGELAGSATNALLQPGLKSFTGTQTPAAGAPKAYLNYVVLDEKSFKAVQSGFVAVPQITGTMQKQLLQLNSGSDITVTHNGYLYVWVSNESKGNVYFDDIRAEHQQGPLLEENHYYPYGLKMAALCSKAFGSLLNKFQYQGTYSEFDEETGYNEFALRNYDPQLGRWTGVDPYDEFASPYVGMGNNPVRNVDPSGGGLGDPPVHTLAEVIVKSAPPSMLFTLAKKAIGYTVTLGEMYYRYQNGSGQEFRSHKLNEGGLNDDVGEHYNYVGQEQDYQITTVYAVDNTAVHKAELEKIQHDYGVLWLFRYVGNVGGNGRRYRNGYGEERVNFSQQALGNEELGSTIVFNTLTVGSGLWKKGATEVIEGGIETGEYSFTNCG